MTNGKMAEGNGTRSKRASERGWVVSVKATRFQSLMYVLGGVPSSFAIFVIVNLSGCVSYVCKKPHVFFTFVKCGVFAYFLFIICMRRIIGDVHEHIDKQQDTGTGTSSGALCGLWMEL